MKTTDELSSLMHCFSGGWTLASLPNRYRTERVVWSSASLHRARPDTGLPCNPEELDGTSRLPERVLPYVSNPNMTQLHITVIPHKVRRVTIRHVGKPLGAWPAIHPCYDVMGKQIQLDILKTKSAEKKASGHTYERSSRLLITLSPSGW